MNPVLARHVDLSIRSRSPLRREEAHFSQRQRSLWGRLRMQPTTVSSHEGFMKRTGCCFGAAACNDLRGAAGSRQAFVKVIGKFCFL